MDRSSWDKFCKTRKKFRDLIDDIGKFQPDLKAVYNNALEDVTCDSEIKLILAGDNPGKKEYETGRYLVGPSGKIADKFFRDNPALGIDFYRNVIILNKTPIHTTRTILLKDLCKTNDAGFSAALTESQKKMACLLYEFQTALAVPVYITGYSEMKKKGLFETYTEELKQLYKKEPQLYKQLFIFRHFSMNQFSIDLKKQALPGESVSKSLKRIGTAYRKRILYLQ